MMKKQFLVTALIAAVVSIGTYALVQKVWEPQTKVRVEHQDLGYTAKMLYTTNSDGELVPLDFTETAKKSMPAIVRIISKVPYSRGPRTSRQLPDPFKEFFDEDFFPFRFEERDAPRRKPQDEEEHYGVGQGSGVIINANGYIVTNNHVIDGASEVEVVLDNNKKYTAKVIGTDPTTDLGLIKIEEKNLPTLTMVNSDDVEIGEWVLALGNPLSLNKTVTAGIVSAKGRNIDILRQSGTKYAIESFIQTDAAINKGNSGGALVNLNGDLIGINSAIASPTGYYSGYGFAIPSNIVNKVVEDLMKFGEVQRGLLGIEVISLADSRSSLMADSLGIYNGAYVANVLENSAAKQAGMKKGDIIVGADQKEIQTSAQLLEHIGQKRPGDMVKIKVNRDGDIKQLNVKLKAKEKTSKRLVYSEDSQDLMDDLGVVLAEPSEEELRELNTEYGLKITRLQRGLLYQQTQIQEGFIITKVDGQPVKGVEDFVKKVKSNKGSGILLEGYYPGDNKPSFYGFGLPE